MYTYQIKIFKLKISSAYDVTFSQEGAVSPSDANEIHPLFHETKSGTSYEVYQTENSHPSEYFS